jgi:hypothetical protein
MIHFDAKHQKSEAKTKVKKQKLSEKIGVQQKLSEKKRKKSGKKRKKAKKVKKSGKKRKNILEFRFALFRFEAKITKAKRSETFKAKKAKKSEKK